VAKNVVIAVDATGRSLDPLALGKLLAECSGAPVVLGSVFPYHPLADPTGEELARVREEARAILRELADEAGVDVADAQVVASNLAARELQRVTEQETTGLIVVGSTSRGAVGRLLVGGVGERLLAGSASPVAIAPRAYAEHPPDRLERIGVAFDGSDESRHAMQAGRRLVESCGAKLRVITVFEHRVLAAQATLVTGGASINDLVRSELRSALDGLLAEQPDDPPWKAASSRGPPASSWLRKAPSSI